MICTNRSTRGSRRPAAGPVQAVLLALTAAAQVLGADFQGSTHLMPFEEDTINYSKAAATGPVARLQERIDRGEVRLRYEDQFGYLMSVLDALKVPKSSQLLVFSKTSFQRERIAPKTPRAVYYNDEVYVGYVIGSSLLELTSVDPKLGAVFYTLEQTRADKPRFVRNDQCLECHASAKTMGVPGHLIRSFTTDEQGVVDLSSGTSLVNHRTPLAERWGGWYVTGEHGAQVHRGNLFGKAAFARQAKEPNFLGNQAALDRLFDVTQVPLPKSDIVSLLVFEHQAHMHNFLTRLQYESTIALAQYGHLNYLRSVSDSFVKYLLFTEETVLTAPVRGDAEFVRAFEAAGPRDRAGRSLRELDLKTRLFKYPCSYLIYSDAFRQLPARMKEGIYQRLHDVLTGKDERPEFEGLSEGTRRAILEILQDTVPELPPYWRPARQAAR